MKFAFQKNDRDETASKGKKNRKVKREATTEMGQATGGRKKLLCRTDEKLTKTFSQLI